MLIITASLTITEVCSNPPDETYGEFVELYNDSTSPLDITGFTVTDGDALDDLLPWSGTFPQSGVQTGTSVIPAGGYAVLFEEGYVSDPWLTVAPGTVILTTGDNSICNGLAASSDPLTLFNPMGTTTGCVVSTFGTPYESDVWDERDDDGLDSIPFDPGDALSLFRYPLNMPDCEAAWFAGEPTPGAHPEAPPDTFFITIDSLWLSDIDPDPGSGAAFTSILSCWGTVSPDTGSVVLFLDFNGDSAAQSQEVLTSFPALQLQPGVTDTVETFFTAPDTGWYPAACSAPGVSGRIHFTTGGGVSPVITEVMANPENEDTEEFFEVWYPGPGAFPLHGCSFTDGDAVDVIASLENGGYVTTESPGVVIDPEYSGSLDIPPGTPLFTPGNTTMGNGLTTDDPILLYMEGEPSLATLLATAGTPLLFDDPLMCDDDGLDSIPFDPGNGRSMERLLPEGPDLEYNWTASQPGGTPGTVEAGQGWTDLAADSVTWDGVLRGHFSNRGSSAASGVASLFSESDGNLLPDPPELIHQVTLELEPGGTEMVEIAWQPPDSGLFVVAAGISSPGDTTVSNDVKYMTLVPGKPSWPVVSEVLCNPSDEDRDEFVELFFSGPGLAEITLFAITDGDSQDELIALESQFLPPGGYCLVMDPEYAGGYDIPPGTPVFHPGNTTIGDGLSGTDPVILLLDTLEVSTYGTPWDPADGIPYDPGTDLSVERISPWLPDSEASWYSSPAGPTPGLPPQGITQGVDYSLAGVSASPPMGPEATQALVIAEITALGTDSVSFGDLSAAFDGSQPAAIPVPGLGDTVTVHFEWTSPGGSALPEARLFCTADEEPGNDSAPLSWNPDPTVVINELFSREPEWMELLNATGMPVNLCSLTISDGSATSGLPEFILDPGKFVVLACEEDEFTSVWGVPPCEVLEPEGWPTLNDSGDSLRLDGVEVPLDFVPYLPSWGGSAESSLERRSAEAFGFLEENWGSCTCSGTPGGPNSIGETLGGDFLELSPTVFNPPSTPLTITVNLPQQACNVTVKVYDVRGMELERPFDGIVPGETLAVSWNGEGFPVGRYIIYAEAVCSGETLSDAAVVVLARPLR